MSDRGTLTSPDTARLVQLVEQLRTHNEQLERALESRIAIEQAKGILCERYALDMKTAFEVLRRAARTHRVRIHELAGSVIRSPRTPSVIELELARGRPAKGPFPVRAAGIVH